MYSTLCVDTNHDVTTFEVDEIVSNIKKINILKGKQNFHEIGKFLNCI